MFLILMLFNLLNQNMFEFDIPRYAHNIERLIFLKYTIIKCFKDTKIFFLQKNKTDSWISGTNGNHSSLILPKKVS